VAQPDTFMARYAFECPVCHVVVIGNIRIAAKNEADARQEFRGLRLRCERCPAQVAGDAAVLMHIGQEAA